MKMFWWTAPDVVNMTQPVLYSVADDGLYPKQSYDSYGDTKRMVEDGYQEISWNTARALGYPA